MDRELKIYRITNLVNDKIYIGQTIQSLNRRLQKHFNSKSDCPKLVKAFNKYGKENFIIELLMGNIQTPEETDFWEQYWIKVYDSIKTGYNISVGGKSGWLGHHHTDESKHKIGLKSLGRTHTEENKKLMSHCGTDNGMYGKTHSDEAKQKISDKNRGRRAWNKGLKKVDGKYVRP